MAQCDTQIPQSVIWTCTSCSASAQQHRPRLGPSAQIQVTIPTKRLASNQSVQTGPVADEKIRQILKLLPMFDLGHGAADKLLTSDLDPLTNF